MSYQPLFISSGAAVVKTNAETNYLEGETTSLRVGQPIQFYIKDNSVIIGGVVANTVYYIKEIIDGGNFTISNTLDGDVFELEDGEGLMLFKFVEQEKIAESLRKIDVMLKEIYDSGIGVQVGITSVSADTSPSLGGDLNLDNKNISGNGNIEINGIVTANKFRLPALTVAQRNAILDWQNGDLIYNLTTSKIQGYQNSTWVNMDGTVV